MPPNDTTPRTAAKPYDHTLRYLVPSRRNPRETYVVELDAYNGNGQCLCKHFVCRLEPLLRRNVTPHDAVAVHRIRIKEGRHVEDALRCEHILTARSQFCDDVIAAIREQETPK